MSEDDPAEDPGGLRPEAAGEPDRRREVPALGEESSVEAYQQRTRLAEDRLAEVLKAYREFRRETEAYRDRLTRQLQRRFEQRHDALLLKFIDILDNFDRALEAAQTAGDSLIEGLILVRTQLLQMLQEEGLERIPVLGLPFDPHVAEAVGAVPVDDSDQHHVVVQEMLRGYRIRGRIARPAQVLFGEYAGAHAAEGMPVPRHSTDILIGVPASVPAVVPEPAEEEDAGPSLDEIIARAEAREATAESGEMPVILYDDLTELPEAAAAAEEEPGGDEEEG